jgi:AraC-like DNA-binding protein
MHTLVFDSTDLDRTEEFLSTHYAPLRIASTTPDAPTHIAWAASGSIGVDHIELGFEMTYDVQPLGWISLCDIVSGAFEDHAVAGWRTREAFGPGDVFTLAPPDLPYTGRLNRARYRVTRLASALLDQVAAPERGAEPVRLLDHRPVSAAAAERLRRAVGHVDRQVLAVPPGNDSPLLVATASRYLAACVLTAFPNTGLVDPTASDRRDAGSAVVRRAVEYIEANADSDLSPADIAAAAHITVRGLQYAFRRHLDTTPMAYVRRVRLDRAHRELLAADPGSGATVAAIAARWGFLHQGRFVATYRSVHGRTPGQTLRG